jgi:hypothetical protein
MLSVLDNVNTQAAEQTFSWIRQYAAMISSMNWLHAPIFMLTLFHLKNLSLVRRRPSDIFPAVGLEAIVYYYLTKFRLLLY